MKICVVGAGPSGMICTRKISSMLPQAEVMTFEQSFCVGGTWNLETVPKQKFSNEEFTQNINHMKEYHPAAYEGLLTNTSREDTFFTDYPLPQHYPAVMTREQIIDYLTDYTRHYNLLQYIHFGCTVECVTPIPDAANSQRPLLNCRWRVQVKKKKLEEAESVTKEVYEFDYVFVCSGRYWNYFVPENIENLQQFKGELMHSLFYRTASIADGKTIIIEGLGISGNDILSQLEQRNKAARIIISTRNVRKYRPISLDEPQEPTASTTTSSITISTQRRSALGSLTSLLPAWLLAATNGVAPPMTKAQKTPVLWKPLIRRIDSNGSTVVFEDSTTVSNVDLILFCTGYNFCFPYLDVKALDLQVFQNPQRMDLFLHVVDPRYLSLFFIGTVNVSGSVFPIVEKQAEWVCSILKGDAQFPPEEVMNQEVERFRSFVHTYKPAKPMMVEPIQYKNKIDKFWKGL